MVPYDRLLIATGARPRRPAIPGSRLAHCLRSVDDAVALRHRLAPGSRLLVIGGGFIGLEVAASAIQRDVQVTIVEFAHRLMSRVVPAAVAQVVHNRHVKAGCDLRLGIAIRRLVENRGQVDVELSDGSRLTVDLVVAGVGALPNVELGATAGLSMSNGIAVDAGLRTSDEAIFAAGDCCSVAHPLYEGARVRVEAWRNAVSHAEVAAENMLGGERIYNAVPWFWSDQYELGLQIARLHSLAVTDVARRRPDGFELRFGLDAAGRVVSASGVAPGQSIARDIRAAERLIASRSSPNPADLANPSVSLRSFLPATEVGPADLAEALA
jgi:3-phenylpropionate/trans-cinnamate dioxygenase ferredoxin reductase subunit